MRAPAGRCILDVKPRCLDSHACNMLANLAEMMARDIEMRWVLAKQRRMGRLPAKAKRPKECYEDGLLVLDTTRPKWGVMHANVAMSWLTGLPRQQLLQSGLWDVLVPHAEVSTASASLSPAGPAPNPCGERQTAFHAATLCLVSSCICQAHVEQGLSACAAAGLCRGQLWTSTRR